MLRTAQSRTRRRVIKHHIQKWHVPYRTKPYKAVCGEISHAEKECSEPSSQAGTSPHNSRLPAGYTAAHSISRPTHSISHPARTIPCPAQHKSASVTKRHAANAGAKPHTKAQKGKPQCKAATGNAPGEQKRDDKTPRRTAFRRTHGRPRNFPSRPRNSPRHPRNSPRRRAIPRPTGHTAARTLPRTAHSLPRGAAQFPVPPAQFPPRPRKRSVFACVPLYYII